MRVDESNTGPELLLSVRRGRALHRSVPRSSRGCAQRSASGGSPAASGCRPRARWLPQSRVEGAAAGLHAVVRLPAPVDADDIRERALTRGVSVYPMSAWYADPPPETTRLVLGYGALTPPAIAEGVRRLSEMLAHSWC